MAAGNRNLSQTPRPGSYATRNQIRAHLLHLVEKQNLNQCMQTRQQSYLRAQVRRAMSKGSLSHGHVTAFFTGVPKPNNQRGS